MKACNTTIRGNTYKYYTLTGRKSFRVFRKLSAIFGTVFNVGSMRGGEDAGALISGFLFALGDDDFDEISETLFEGVEVNGESINIDLQFSGHITDMVELMVAIIQENYSDFFTESGTKGIIQRITAIFPQPKDSKSSKKDSTE